MLEKLLQAAAITLLLSLLVNAGKPDSAPNPLLPGFQASLLPALHF